MKFVVKMNLSLQTDFVHIRREKSRDLGNKYSVWFLETEILKSSVKGKLITLTYLCFSKCRPIILPRRAILV